MKNYSSLSALFRDVGLSIVKKHKATGLSSICPFEFAEKIDAIDLAEDADKITLGEIKDLLFSIIGGVLMICWRDPLDVVHEGSVITYFGATTLRAKLDGYPIGPEDGILIYSGMTRDKHASIPLAVDLDSLGLIQDDGEGGTQTIYFKFFSKTSGSALHDGIWNTDTLIGDANLFSSESYDWNAIYSALKDYPTAKALSVLPEAGSKVFVNYMIRDYYLSSGINVAAETRQDVVNNVDKLSAVAIPWTILGYNANVPQYVGYKRLDSLTLTYNYMYVLSIDDSVSLCTLFKTDGTLEAIELNVGNKQFRNIVAGCLTYTEDEWDYQINKKSYTKNNYIVDAVSESTFGYNNEGTGTLNVYQVPIKISADGYEWDFCGYTMTILPLNALISINRTSNTATTMYTNILVDATEIRYADIFELFPDDTSGGEMYVRIEDDGLHEIDWSLSTSMKVNELPYDVYKIEDGRLELKTSYFLKYCNYVLKSTDAETGAVSYEKLAEVEDFYVGAAYYNSCNAKSYEPNNANYGYLSVYADVVRYDDLLYLCKTNVAIGLTKTFELLSASNFRSLTSTTELALKDLYDAGMYFVTGLKMPLTMFGKEVVLQNMLYCYVYGRNVYEQSFYKQYANNINGSRRFSDSPYKPQHKHDVVSTAGLANANSLMLKLYKEQQMIRHIVPAVNRTVVSPINGPFRPDTYIKNNRLTWETSIDLFWPLANYEVFGAEADASSTFSKVYPDNASRIKTNLAADGSAGTSAVFWWLRYPLTGYSHLEYLVNPSGALTNYTAGHSFGFVPACIIG